MTTIPTPGDVARAQPRPPAARTARDGIAPPPRRKPTLLRESEPYRARYEQAIRLSGLEHRTRYLALTVATYADYDTGHIPETAVVGVDSLSRSTGLTVKAVRVHIHLLQERGFLERGTNTGGDQVKVALRIPGQPGPR